MPREQWAVDIRVLVRDALKDIARVEAALKKLRGSGAKVFDTGIKTLQTDLRGLASQVQNFGVIKPQVDPRQAIQGFKTVQSSAKRTQAVSKSFVNQLRADFSNFGNILAKRFAFTVATAFERTILNAVRSVGRAFREIISVGAEFENSIRRAATVAVSGTGNVAMAMQQLGSTAREVAATTTFTATEISNAMFELVSVGLTIPEVNAAIRSSTQFAIAAQTDLETAIGLTTQVMKSFGLEGEDLADVADILVGSINRSTLNVQRLTNAMRFAAPAAGAVGLSVTDTVAVIAQFVDVTKQGGISGRAFRFAIQAFLDPSEEAKKRLDELNISIRDADGGVRNFTDVLVDLALSGFRPAVDAALVFGRRAGSVIGNTVRNLRRQLGEGVNSIEEFKRSLEADAEFNRAEQQARAFLDTLTSQFNLTTAKLEELALIAFSQIGSLVEFSVRAFNKFLDAMILVGNEAANLTPVILGLAAAFSASKATGLGAILLGIIRLFTRTRGQLALLLSPLGRVAQFLGFTGVSGRSLSRVFTGLGRAIFSTTTAAVGLIATWAAAIQRSAAFRITVDALRESFMFLDGVVKEFTGLTLGELLTALSETVVGTIRETFRRMVDLVDAIFGGILLTVLNFVDSARESLETLPEALRSDAVVSGLNRLEEGARSALTQLAKYRRELEASRKAGDRARETFKTYDDVLTKNINTSQDVDEATERVVETFNNFVANGDDASQAAEFVRKGLERVVAQANELGEAVDPRLLEILAALAESAEEVNDKLLKLKNEALSELGVDLPGITEQFEGLMAGIEQVLADPNLSKAFKETVLRQLLLDTIEQRDKMIEELGVLPPEIARIFEEVIFQARGKLGELAPNVIDPVLFEEMLKRFEEEGKEFGDDAGEIIAESIEDGFKDIEFDDLEFDFAEPTEGQIDRIKDAFERLEQEPALEGFLDELRDEFARALADMLLRAKSFSDAITKIFRALFAEQFTSAIQGFISSFRNAFDAVADAQTEIGRNAQGFFGSLKEGFKSLGSSLTSTQFLVTAAATAITALFSLFGSDEIDEIKADFAEFGEISDDLAERINEVAEQQGRWTAELQFFGEILDEVGVTTENFERLAQKLFLGLVNIDLGNRTAAESASDLDGAFKELTDEMERLGIEVSPTIIRFIRDVKNRGLEIPSVMEFIREAAERAASGLVSVFGTAVSAADEVREARERAAELQEEAREAEAAGDFAEAADLRAQAARLLEQQFSVFQGTVLETQEDVDRLGRLALVAFNQMIESGASVTQAVDAIGPSLDALIIRLQESGFEGSKALKQLLRFRRLVEANRELVDSVSGLNDLLIGLANTGNLTQTSFNDLQVQAQRMFEELTEAGFSGNEALKILGPSLSNIIKLAQELGLEIDEDTQKLIDQAGAAGFLSDESQSAADIMKKGFDQVTRAINRLIETLGGVPLELDGVAEKIGDVGDAGDFAFRRITEGAGSAFDTILTGADEAVLRMTGLFEQFEDDMVGDSVFPDVAAGALDSLDEIRQGTKNAVDFMIQEFRAASLQNFSPDLAQLIRQGATLGPQDVEFFLHQAELQGRGQQANLLREVLAALRQQNNTTAQIVSESGMPEGPIKATIEFKGNGTETAAMRDAAKRLNRAETTVRFTRRG